MLSNKISIDLIIVFFKVILQIKKDESFNIVGLQDFLRSRRVTSHPPRAKPTQANNPSHRPFSRGENETHEWLIETISSSRQALKPLSSTGRLWGWRWWISQEVRFFCCFCTRQATTRTLCLNLSIQSKGCSINQINNANKFVPVEGGCFGGVESGWGRLGLAPYGLGRN